MATAETDLGDRLELAQALARFKLQVRRKLNQAVDLERMKSDRVYARQRLAEIEELVDDEDLLVALIMLRERLCPASEPEALAQPSQPALPERYRFGVRR